MTAPHSELPSLRPDRIGVEVTDYEPDDGPVQQRVDLVRADTDTTTASLTPYQALTLASELISAVQQVRENGRS